MISFIDDDEFIQIWNYVASKEGRLDDVVDLIYKRYDHIYDKTSVQVKATKLRKKGHQLDLLKQGRIKSDEEQAERVPVAKRYETDLKFGNDASPQE